MTTREKYNLMRNRIPNGSVAICRGSSFISKAIQYADSDITGIFVSKKHWAWSNHSMLLFWQGDRLFACHSNADGVDPSFASNALSQYEDFRVFAPGEMYSDELIINAVNKTLFQVEETKVNYDFNALLVGLITKRLGIKINNKIKEDVSICSKFTGLTYAKNLGMNSWWKNAESKGIFTPEDHIRYNDQSMVEIKLIKKL